MSRHCFRFRLPNDWGGLMRLLPKRTTRNPRRVARPRTPRGRKKRRDQRQGRWKRVLAVLGGLGLVGAVVSAMTSEAVKRGLGLLDRPQIQVAVILDQPPPILGFGGEPRPKGCNAACSDGFGIIQPVFLVPTSEPPPSLPSDADAQAAWFKAHGIPAYRQKVRLIIASRDNTPVVITGISARVISKETPPEGWFTLASNPECGGGVLNPVPVTVDLGRPRPTTSYADWPKDKKGSPTPLTATKESPQFIDIEADPGRYLVEWALQVDYVLGGKVKEYSVTSASGRSLRVTALLPDRAKAYLPIWHEDSVSLQRTKQLAFGDPPIIYC